ncbi:MAG: hypothetical protein FWC47_15675 [Oscillospiraceae bacterium]|nr:hypothetical protein [Oscillospiraceae bacterium]
MNKESLIKELENKKIPKDAYSLSGGLPNEAFCFNQINGIWEVYYSERGIKSGLKTFVSECDACIFFLDLVVKACFKK